MRTLETILAIAFLVVTTEMVFGAEAEFVQENCASCHALTEPDFESLGIEARAERKAPPLYYAGDKRASIHRRTSDRRRMETRLMKLRCRLTWCWINLRQSRWRTTCRLFAPIRSESIQ